MQEQDPPMFNKFIFDECFIFILLIQFHLHLLASIKDFRTIYIIFSFKILKKHPASARCSVKKYLIFTCLHFQCSHYNIPNF